MSLTTGKLVRVPLEALRAGTKRTLPPPERKALLRAFCARDEDTASASAAAPAPRPPSPPRERPAFELDAGWPLILAGGLLVGFGTRLGSGCTSGHGVCGLSRLSPRSMVSVVLFMAAGMATVALIKLAVGG